VTVHSRHLHYISSGLVTRDAGDWELEPYIYIRAQFHYKISIPD
jgi:hypothetical protein